MLHLLRPHSSLYLSFPDVFAYCHIHHIFKKKDYKPCRFVKKIKTHHLPGPHDPGSGTPNLPCSLWPSPKTVFPSIWRSLCPILPIPPVSSLCIFFMTWNQWYGNSLISSPGPQTLVFSNLFMCFKAPTYLDIALVLLCMYMFSLSPISPMQDRIFQEGSGSILITL